MSPAAVRASAAIGKFGATSRAIAHAKVKRLTAMLAEIFMLRLEAAARAANEAAATSSRFVPITLPAGPPTTANGMAACNYGFVQNKAQALLDVDFYNVCDDQEGKIMFERLITAIIMVVAVTIVASGLPLSSISGAGSGALGFFNHTIVF